MTHHGEHLPKRPSWDCEFCKEPWPCPAARVELAKEFKDSSISLSIYCATQLHAALEEAMHQHDWVKVDDLYERFMGWLPGGRETEVAP